MAVTSKPAMAPSGYYAVVFATLQSGPSPDHPFDGPSGHLQQTAPLQ
jgi:hypothetical protein